MFQTTNQVNLISLFVASIRLSAIQQNFHLIPMFRMLFETFFGTFQTARRNGGLPHGLYVTYSFAIWDLYAIWFVTCTSMFVILAHSAPENEPLLIFANHWLLLAIHHHHFHSFCLAID